MAEPHVFEVSAVGPWALVALSGEIDIANSGRLRSVVTELVNEGVTDLILDFSQVSSLDASALGAMVVSQTLVASVEGRMVLVGMDAFAARMLAITGLDHVLPVYIVPGPWSSPPSSDSHSVFDGAGLAHQYLQLSQVLASGPTLTGDLNRIVRAAISVIPGCTAATVALIARDAPRTATVSSQTAINVDIAQYTVDEGPCLEAVRAGRSVRLDAVDIDEHFASFAPLALEAGVHAVLSVPVVLNDRLIASLNLYSDTALAFDQRAEPMAELLAAQVATASAKSSFYRMKNRLVGSARYDEDNWPVAHRDDEILSALRSCSLDYAEHLLRSTSGPQHETLSAAAQRMIDQLDPV